MIVMICGIKCKNCIYHRADEDTCNFKYYFKEEIGKYIDVE